MMNTNLPKTNIVPANSNASARRAFTLIELLVVVAIIALLASMLLPSLGRARQITLRTICATNIHQLHIAMTIYQQTNNDIYPCVQDPVSTSPYCWLWMGRGWRKMMEPIFRQRLSKLDPSVLLCPGDPASRDTYEATSYAYSMAFYHSLEQIDALNSKADTYSNPQPFIAQRSQAVRWPSRKILLGEWTANHPTIANDGGWWCWQGQRNYLLADGQIRWLEAGQILPARDGLPDPNLTIGGIAGADLAD